MILSAMKEFALDHMHDFLFAIIVSMIVFALLSLRKTAKTAREMQATIDQFNDLNLVLETLCHHAFSLRGQPLAHIILATQGNLETLRFHENGFTTTKFGRDV
jgi:ABC-type bacteriocin/lantibiotic exporter with double-glycine peptidase domain